MAYIRLCLIVMASGFLAVPGWSQSGDASLAYENWSGTGVNGDSLSLAVRNEFALPLPFSVQGDLSYRDHTLGGASNQTLNGTLHGYWPLAVGKAGIFASYSDISATPNATQRSLGGEVIYPTGAFNLEAWAGIGVLDTGTDIDFNVMGAEGIYPISPPFDLFFRVNFINASGSANDVTDYTFGVDWELPGFGTLTGSIGTADIGGQSADRIGVSYTFPFGGGSTSKRASFFEAARGAFRY